MFRHVMHWVGAERRLPLIFGGAWHNAMDRLWEEAAARSPRSVVIESAFGAFITHWIKEGLPPPHEIDLSTSEDLLPRTPAVALEMLEEYYDRRHRSIMEWEILEIERPFAVPLDPDDDTLFYVGRIDKVVRPMPSSVRGIEHKTTTSMRLNNKRQTISPMFRESFSPNAQVDGYLYTLHMLYPEESLRNRVDVYVDGALVHKIGQDVQFIPVDRQVGHLDNWLWETHHWIKQIEEQRAALAEASGFDKYLSAFPKNTNSCFDFNSACQFLPLCKARPNPLTWDEAPAGYKEERWDPLDHIGTPKELID
jgi:hypothetical protein